MSLLCEISSLKQSAKLFPHFTVCMFKQLLAEIVRIKVAKEPSAPVGVFLKHLIQKWHPLNKHVCFFHFSKNLKSEPRSEFLALNCKLIAATSSQAFCNMLARAQKLPNEFEIVKVQKQIKVQERIVFIPYLLQNFS